ncbi:hypothetical protein [Bordetella genomosp. 13]|uniref:Lipoprotein n=1 Tax=Bordetella genomosp. 13 TaxID=463040 RepID=A0A1W6ZAI4_9BORD|nr:hypothetical protein [Bordetella genomosp. 13]ARP94371.1 hypothetical protein CAL15_08215 [Bordetella genomosp. 13]
MLDESYARPWRRLGACLLLGMTLALSACGGDDHDSDPDDGGGETPTEPGTPPAEQPQLRCAP